jgi:hypothetical protein
MLSAAYCNHFLNVPYTENQLTKCIILSLKVITLSDFQSIKICDNIKSFYYIINIIIY